MADLSADSLYLRQTLRLAARGRYRTSPNPMVGAVVVRRGEVVGRGYHGLLGGPHAETRALQEAGERARGAILYASLEPCTHHGRTPPCADAIIEAGVTRVVSCHRDPDPRVAGRGFESLRRAGLEVRWGVLVEEAVELNLNYLVASVCQRPAVTLKWAMSLDGKIATRGGESQWISSPSGRRWALAFREAHDAILVGSGTALADDPRLNRRLGLARGANVRVILDRRLRLEPRARLFRIEGPVVVYTESRRRERRRALEATGAEVVVEEAVTPESVLSDLFGRGVRSVLVEGGGEVVAAFARAGFFDRVAVDCAPLLIGGRQALGPLGGDGFAALADAHALEKLRSRRRGGDLLITAYRKGCLQALCKSVGA
jgi:diaminohydroxyphosphoribosylaminopyrimidine deaminase/5-amino-6-(5-phosphoribosylamino)uracil reductase